MQGRTNYLHFFLASTLLLISCAKERNVKALIPNGKRVPVATFDGTFLFQKTVTNIQYAGKENSGTPIGSYEAANKLIQFDAKEKTLDITAIDPLFKSEKAALRSTLLASFPIKHVDVLRKQNPDGSDTNEEEETESRRPWQQRTYVIVDPTKDAQDAYSVDSDYATTPDNIEIDAATGAINIDVNYQLKDNTQVGLRYSFLKYQPSTTYLPKEYPLDLSTRFGFFSTSTLKFDKYGRVLESEAQKSTVVNRWDTSKKIVYYLSKDFPERLKPAAQKVFAEWNQAFKAATGKDSIELRENTGQKLGDLRYSMLYYDASVDASHGILGYGPSYANPRTGEIIKADVILYGGVLKSSIYRERIWESLLGDIKPLGNGGPAMPTNLGTGAIKMPVAQIQRKSSLPLGLGLGDFSDLKMSIRASDKHLVKLMKEDYHPIATLQQIRAEMIRDHQTSITRMNEDVMSAIQDGLQIQKMTDDELEAAIFMPLLTHELGHNWGLRHNFMGSFDNKHFNSSKSSSVMDYGFLVTHEPAVPGPYDKAAIQVAYANNEAVTKNLLGENYYFCTDDDVFSSQSSMCNQFDAGSSLVDVVNSQFRRYVSSYLFNNLKNDRVYFGTAESFREYMGRIRRSLIPIRLMYDHSDAVLRAATSRSIENLWLLSKQRIEADNKSDPANVVTIKVMTGMSVQQQDGKFAVVNSNVERKVDVSKIPAIISDARNAKNLSYNALITIIQNTSRADFNSGDQLQGQLQVRGVIYDKMIALLLAGTQMRDPLGSNSAVTLFTSSEGGDFKAFLAGILSDTAPVAPASPDDAPTYDFSPSDPNLKELALDLIVNELAVPGASAQARQLIALLPTDSNLSNEGLKKDKEFRVKIQGAFKQLLKGGQTDQERAALGAQIGLLQSQRNQTVFVAATALSGVGTQILMAPTVLPDLALATASGHLIRDTINPFEDIVAAAKDLVFDYTIELLAEMAKPEAKPLSDEKNLGPKNLRLTEGDDTNPPAVVPPPVTRDPKKVLELLTKIESLNKTVTNISDLLENERLFLDKYYRAYSGR